MQVQINGETKEFSDDRLSLVELIRELSLAPQRIAVELNKQIVRRQEWDLTFVNDGDRVEIVHFVGGGSAYASCTIAHQQFLGNLFEPISG